MSTAGSPDANAPVASDIAARLREAAFVRLIAAGTGDAVAATGLLAGALDEQGIAYQTTVAPLPAPTERETSADLTLALGRPSPDADLTLTEEPVAPAALAIVRELGTATRRQVVLALAGALAAGYDPDEQLLAMADDQLDRQPGVAIPVGQPADGLAHSTLVHAPFSGSVDRAGELAAEEPRTVASALALAVAGDPKGTPQGAYAVERLLRPYVCEPFRTVGGYASVLDALARERPGHAVAVALGADLDVLDSWRAHARTVHESIRTARTGRYDGLFVVRCEGTPPVGVICRLVREYRSPEPVVLAVSEREGAMSAPSAATLDVGAAMRAATAAVGGSGGGTRRRGRARFDEQAEFVLAAREQL